MIKHYRIKRGLTQKQLGERCGLSQPNISRMERTGVDNVNMATVRKLAKALNIKTYRLVDQFERAAKMKPRGK